MSDVSGFVKPGFEAVREAFVENFELRHELGAACCVYHRGEKVVDLWGGVRNKATGAPWEEDTLVIAHSSTQGMSALAMALAHSRGLFEYDEPVAAYWPEFAQGGKAKITVRHLLSHQAGLYALDEPLTQSLVADPERLAAVLARQRPAFQPALKQAYHGVTLGFYESELLRRVDPRHRTLGQFFHEELATPLGLDFYLRLPATIPDSRLATPDGFSLGTAFWNLPLRTSLAVVNPRSRFRRCLLGSELPEQSEHIYARNLEVPSRGGVGTARAMAHAYSVFATGGKEVGLSSETFRELVAPPNPPAHGFGDACLKLELRFSLGFTKPLPKLPFAHPSAFGDAGTGGAVGFADPEAQLGYAYVPNRTSPDLSGPREVALRTAMYRSIGEADPLLVGANAPPRGAGPRPRLSGQPVLHA